jgi:ribose transport system permease protein
MSPTAIFRKYELQNYIVYVGFIAIFLFFAITLHDAGFTSTRNLTNIILQTAPATIMAIGLVFALSAGEILAGLGAGLAVGAFNGLMVAWLRLPSFLVTLATLGLFAGVARTMTNLRSIPVTNDVFTGVFGSGDLFGIPSLVWWTITCVAVGHIVYRHTRFGAHVLATGDNARAAQVSGIKVPRIRFIVLTICGGCAGLAGLLYAGRLQSATYTLGESDLMIVIAAVIVGGTSLNGGKGSIIGALIGSLLMGMLNNGLILMGLQVSDQMIVRGLIILVAVAASLRDTTR